MAKFLDVGSINRAPKALTKDSLWDLPEPPIAGVEEAERSVGRVREGGREAFGRAI